MLKNDPQVEYILSKKSSIWNSEKTKEWRLEIYLQRWPRRNDNHQYELSDNCTIRQCFFK